MKGNEGIYPSFYLIHGLDQTKPKVQKSLHKIPSPKCQSDINNTWGITPRPNRKRIWNERAIDGDEKAIDGENERGKIPMNSMGYRME